MDLIIEAMEHAFYDKMDIINLSLGGGSAWADYPDSAVARRLAERGLVIVAAIENDGSHGLWEAWSPAISPPVFGITSLDNFIYLSNAFAASHGNVGM